MIQGETVGHHSANVAYIVSVIMGDNSLLYPALLHDIGESYTGDVPYPFKQQHPQIKKYLDRCEEHFLQMNGMNFGVTEEQHNIIKAADMLDLVLKCFDELSLGNSTVQPMILTGISVLQDLKLPEGPQERLDDILKEIGTWAAPTKDK